MQQQSTLTNKMAVSKHQRQIWVSLKPELLSKLVAMETMGCHGNNKSPWKQLVGVENATKTHRFTHMLC